ncbi:MAG: sigma-70 family RNA polymerase sigma factor [Ginsengibacter sp.]
MNKNEQKQIFEDWLDKYKALIFKIVKAYALSAADQNDLFQEITIQLWHSIPTFRKESSTSTWVYRISLNTAIKWVRKEQKHYQSEPLDNVEIVLKDSGSVIDERLAWLYEEIHQLDEIDRSVALLMLDGFSYKEMAGILGITESNVGVKINRIKKYLITKSKKYVHHGI